MADCGRCWKCKEGTGCIRSVSFAPTAMPGRHPEAVEKVATEKAWDKDIPAYRRLRANGIQPKRIDDSAQLEARANDQFEVEMATIVPENMKSRVRQGLEIVQQLDQAENKPKVVYPDGE